ncbi:phosphoribosylanthranilate isomerase [Marinilongibacter aquaticus]|uniref:phosphoribosylanthranilate isomerase n=1 Tax=Marinilongibacter aquaticus TaxID=2975157 RepID=UPI0021BD2234|nr:phosphoribosylanthranilate isomerase [Marinilongibacter aquaticus]UBM59882.1 phosphoribosylanthranilate isomerase [Marinilongibacter aquaticus]
MNQSPKVKICCISSENEAQMAIQYGAAALGLVGPMPSGPGIIDDVLIRQIAKTVPPPISTFLLSSETKADSIIAHYQKVYTTTIQIVDALHENQYQHIREALPHVKLVQVIHVIDQNSVKEAIEVSSHVDAILLDSGNPNLAVKELGGTGRTHDWKLSKEIKERVSVPIFLAGGLNKDNVRRAIDTVEPFGLDLCSGVRSGGNLDERKLEAFFQAIY